MQVVRCGVVHAVQFVAAMLLGHLALWLIAALGTSPDISIVLASPADRSLMEEALEPLLDEWHRPYSHVGEALSPETHAYASRLVAIDEIQWTHSHPIATRSDGRFIASPDAMNAAYIQYRFGVGVPLYGCRLYLQPLTLQPPHHATSIVGGALVETPVVWPTPPAPGAFSSTPLAIPTDGVLPLTPLWAPLLLATLALTSPYLVLRYLVPTMRRAARLRVGKCPKCAYPRSAVTRCSECGH